MRVREIHPWNLSPAEAIDVQRDLRRRLVARDRLGRVQRVAGVDVGFDPAGRVGRAAVAVLAWPDLELVDSAVVRSPVSFPYVPGLLSFREVPAILAALRELRRSPDLIVCDGQGYAHPRRFGLACHLGVMTQTPTIGAAKTRLLGTHEEVPATRGAWRALCDRGEVVGAVVRTRDGTRPLYVSIGHRVSLATAVEWVFRLTPRYRLPETTRQAHRLASG